MWCSVNNKELKDISFKKGAAFELNLVLSYLHKQLAEWGEHEWLGSEDKDDESFSYFRCVQIKDLIDELSGFSHRPKDE